MEHYFEIPVSCDGDEQILKGRLVTFGYDYKFYIVVKGEELVFEKDEQGDFRAISQSPVGIGGVDTKLVGAIVNALQQLSVH
ncbi:hypothetical protein QEG73_01350 [Chitinophagaceae bacterium 26-R-25]|nr:hypothetical protein [Chitinophagaceae bacterium 26-R-25]